MKRIGMRRSQTRDGPPRLGPRSRKFRMRMAHASDLRESSIKSEVGRQVRRRPQFPFDNPPVKIGYNQIGKLELIVGNATRFNNYEPLVAGNAASISKRIKRQSPADQFKIGLEHLFAQLLHTHGLTFAIPSRRKSG